MLVGVDDEGVVLEDIGVVEPEQYFLRLGREWHHVDSVNNIHFPNPQQIGVGPTGPIGQQPPIGRHNNNLAGRVDTMRVDARMELPIIPVHQQPLTLMLDLHQIGGQDGGRQRY